MIAIKMLRFAHLLCYLIIVSQSIYYFLILADALQMIRLQNFIELRKVVDPLIQQRFVLFYYACFALSLPLIFLSVKNPFSPFFISALITFACLLADIILALKGNVPLNAQVNAHAFAGAETDWENIRERWLYFIRMRSMICMGGFISLLAGLVWERA